MATGANKISARELLVLAKNAALRLRDSAATPTARLGIATQLLEDGNHRSPEFLNFREKLADLDIDTQHYWVGTFYTLLLPSAQRKSQAAYFTPPQLSKSILQLLLNEGFDPKKHCVADPAAGGAAFLSTIAGLMADQKVSNADIVRRLNGFEIDSGLARLSEHLIGKRLGVAVRPGTIVTRANSLSRRSTATYDVVIANPPYGRVSLRSLKSATWDSVCHPGHINKYALFTELCLRLTKPDGLMALVLPSSFIGGPLYDRLRKHIRAHAEVILLGSVVGRENVFIDVTQDISILIARVGKEHQVSRPITFGLCIDGGPLKPVAAACLPLLPGDAWVAPSHVSGHAIGGATLDDYEAKVRSGYFVWNREQERMHARRTRKLDVPLIWAQNISAGKFCLPKAKKRKGADFVRFESESAAIIRTNAIVIQRTTNSSQARRLIAGRVAPRILKKYGGFVSENHTIVITAPTIKTLVLLTKLLSSAAVDARYRRLSGTASISVELLRQLDLPHPDDLRDALARTGDIEEAVEAAYAATAIKLAKAVA